VFSHRDTSFFAPCKCVGVGESVVMCVGVGVYVDEWRILVNTQRGGRCESASDASRGRVVGEHVCSLEGGGVSLVCTAPERPSEDTDKIGTRSHARKHARTCTNMHEHARTSTAE